VLRRVLLHHKRKNNIWGHTNMKPYDNNDATRLVEEKFFAYNFENELPGKEDMEKMDSVSTFFEYVHVHAVRCGYESDVTDTGTLASFVSEKCKEAGVYISRQTLVNWLKKGHPANTAGGRENVYRLCFALQMDAQQTGEFFLKAYLERPFNYKDIHEAVYFFSLNNGRTYSDAQRIIAEIESSAAEENPYADNITEQIGERLNEITAEEDLLRYIAENRSGFSNQNQSATSRIEQLVKSCKEIAPKEYAISCHDDKKITVDNIDELLSVIYDYSAREVKVVKDKDGKTKLNDKGKPITKPTYKKSISKSRLPGMIRRNWPQREQFAQILEKRNASYDVIRRALIMLTFYDFAANATVNHALEYGIFDEFVDEMNTVLADCGYVQLYWRNPFDWMIGYCAMSDNPLDTLRNLIDEYYLSDPAVID
jgi:hypothetical protein